MLSGPHSVVFIANTGRDDQPLPDYLKEALDRFQREERPRYCLIAHDLSISGNVRVRSKTLNLSGEDMSVQYAILDMLGKFDPGRY